MRKIEKGTECEVLREWRRNNPQGKYENLDDSTRRAIRQALLDEQYGLCAYCCDQIRDIEHCHNEHLQAQHSHPKRTLDHDNLLASCNAKKQCGDAHGTQKLPLTPLMPECETELRFMWSGRIEGVTERAKESIRVLRLGGKEDKNHALIARRKALCEVLILKQYGASMAELEVEDSAMLELLMAEIAEPKHGRLEPFAPALVNMLRERLANDANDQIYANSAKSAKGEGASK